MELEMTPVETVAFVSKSVSQIADRLLGNERFNAPLFVAFGVTYALDKFSVQSQPVYGKASWIEITEDDSPVWAGAWKEGEFHIWVETQFGEMVDLNTFVSFRSPKKQFKTKLSSPILWSKELPKFYRYQPEGFAELNVEGKEQSNLFDDLTKRIDEKFKTDGMKKSIDSTDFPNEPILCPDRRILDDSKESFRAFDRILQVRGIPGRPW